MTEITALLGLAQLSAFPQARSARLERAEQMQRGLQRIRGVSVGRAPNGQQPIWLYFPVVIDADTFGLTAKEVAAALEYENIFVRRYYSPPCHRLEAYRTAIPPSLPITESISANVLALPVYNNMSYSECAGIVEAISDIGQAAIKITQFDRDSNSKT